MANFERVRREPKTPRRAVLAGSPSFPAQPTADEPAGDEQPKKRATRKKAPKAESDD